MIKIQRTCKYTYGDIMYIIFILLHTKHQHSIYQSKSPNLPGLVSTDGLWIGLNVSGCTARKQTCYILTNYELQSRVLEISWRHSMIFGT